MTEFICFNYVAEWPAGLPEIGEIIETLYTESKPLLGKPAEMMFYNWKTCQISKYIYTDNNDLRWPLSFNGDMLFLYNTDNNSNVSIEVLDRSCCIAVSIERIQIQEMGAFATENWIEQIMSNIFDRSHCVLIAGSELDICVETSSISQIVYNALHDLGILWLAAEDRIIQRPPKKFLAARRFNKYVLLRNIRAEL